MRLYDTRAQKRPVYNKEYGKAAITALSCSGDGRFVFSEVVLVVVLCVCVYVLIAKHKCMCSVCECVCVFYVYHVLVCLCVRLRCLYVCAY